jgi:hypothetical protein
MFWSSAVKTSRNGGSAGAPSATRTQLFVEVELAAKRNLFSLPDFRQGRIYKRRKELVL